MTATSPPPLPAGVNEGSKRLKMAAMWRLAPELLVAAKTQPWKPEEFLRTMFDSEVAARDASDARTRLRQAAFPVTKSLDESDVTASSIPCDVRLPRPAGWVRRRRPVDDRPGRDRQVPILVAIRIAAVEAGHRVRYFTAADPVETLTARWPTTPSAG